MQANRISKRTAVVLFSAAVAVWLLAVASAAAVSSGVTGAASQGRVVFECEGHARFGPPGPVHGSCSITGAIRDRGSFVDDARPCDNPHLRTVRAGKGTIRLEVYRRRGSWMILGGTKAYRGLRGHGWESNDIPCKGPGPRSTAIMMVGTTSR